MTGPSRDDFMLRLAPAPPRPVDPSLLRARESVRGALAELVAVDDAALERGWPWRGGEADVRYGFYRQYEALEDARATSQSRLADAFGDQPPARPLLGAATAARWDLHALLAGLAEDDLDADPGGGEWTVRQTLGHIVGGQRGYGWFTAWWLSHRGKPADQLPERVPDDVFAAAGLPDEADEAAGSLDDIRARLDEILDLSAGVFAALGDSELAAHARWSGVAVDVRFRLVRWSSHIREHTLQLDKTLAMLGRQPSEAARLARVIAGAWGRLEADLYMWPAGEPAVRDALAEAVDAAAGVAADAASVKAAAS